MDLSLKTIAEFDPVRMRAIERRTDDYRYGARRMRGATIWIQNLFLYNDLSARRIDQRFRHYDYSRLMDTTLEGGYHLSTVNVYVDICKNLLDQAIGTDNQCRSFGYRHT